jgi:molecular chaperone HtpG
MTTERHEFQAEVQQLLDLMVHSLYSDKDIFLRELISNASDALDKLRFERLTNPELPDPGEPVIRLAVDREARTLSISDNGIGMSREEVIANIGTIARSGTKEFLRALKEGAKSPELIGQFGVGFYSAFMVADKIVLTTRRAGETGATRWESQGQGAYTVEDAERDQVGTTVTLHLKPEDTEHGLRDYTTDHVLRTIVKRYSDFVAYPIKLGEETLNSMKAIWDRPKSEVTEEEYREFYRHLSHDWHDPLRTIPVKIEGTLEANALLYIPSAAPFDLYSAEMKRGLQLYVKRVFVMDECKELMPQHLRFVKGVVDAHDLSLNVSREILQKDRQIQVIRKQLVKKVLGTLEEMKRDKEEDYLKFWTTFGPALKEGLLPFDEKDKDKLLDLIMAPSTNSETGMTSLEQYVGRMKEGQDAIYFLVGPSRETAARSPLLEAFKAKGYEVLLFWDPVDELWLERAPTYKDKPLRSIGRGEVELGTEEERKQHSEALEEKQRELGDLLTCFRVHLQEDVKDVRLTNRLTSSPVCLVGDEHDPSLRMQRMMEQLGQTPQKVKPILELNPDHALIGKLFAMFRESKSDPRLASYARVLLGQAHLAESGQVPDPDAFSKSLTELMLGAPLGQAAAAEPAGKEPAAKTTEPAQPAAAAEPAAKTTEPAQPAVAAEPAAQPAEPAQEQAQQAEQQQAEQGQATQA